MDEKTGHIHLGLLREEAERRKLVPIPEEQAEAVINMNRRQRRAWAAQQRRRGHVQRTSPDEEHGQ